MEVEMDMDMPAEVDMEMEMETLADRCLRYPLVPCTYLPIPHATPALHVTMDCVPIRIQCVHKKGEDPRIIIDPLLPLFEIAHSCWAALVLNAPPLTPLPRAVCGRRSGSRACITILRG